MEDQMLKPSKLQSSPIYYHIRSKQILNVNPKPFLTEAAWKCHLFLASSQLFL